MALMKRAQRTGVANLPLHGGRALSLVSEMVYGVAPGFRDPRAIQLRPRG